MNKPVYNRFYLVLIFCFVGLLSFQNSFGQSLKNNKSTQTSRALNFLHDENRNALLVNFAGGTVGSLEYERHFQLSSTKVTLLSASLGVGYGLEGQVWNLGTTDSPQSYFLLPHRITYLMGHKHYLEAGVGGLYVGGKTTQPYLAYPILGYRFMNDQSNSVFRIYMGWPFTGIQTEDLGFFPLGFSFGQRF